MGTSPLPLNVTTRQPPPPPNVSLPTAHHVPYRSPQCRAHGRPSLDPRRRRPPRSRQRCPRSPLPGRKDVQRRRRSREGAVEGRIMSLLQGFDKVNDTKNITPAAHFANDL